MNKFWRWLVLGNLLLVAVVAAGMTAQKENISRNGRTVLLKLAPVDPRSLMQGDYMRLNFALGDDMRHFFVKKEGLEGNSGYWQVRDKVKEKGMTRGRVVIRLDAENRAEFVRFDDGGGLADGEMLLRYWGFFSDRGGGMACFGSESFMFEEGKADVFAKAVYGELRVAPDGGSVLVGLRDAGLKKLE